MKTKRKFYRLNQYITAPELRLIDAAGKQIGIVSREEALKKAQELAVDLVEVAPSAKPPVCRLIDFKKFKYLEDKKEREEKKHAVKATIKEIRAGPFISENDFQVRLKRVQEFLKEGNKVKLTVKFTGRQMAHPEFGRQLLERFITKFEEIARVEREPHFEGRMFITMLTPIKQGK